MLNKYGMWTVLEFAFKRGPHKYYLCRCDCGTEKTVQEGSFVSGRSHSCGCHRVRVNRDLHTKHSLCDHPIYQSWTAMRRRCLDKNFQGYKDYGARGITVCERWMTFESFAEDMLPSWSKGMTIERQNVNGNYEPDNCVWATQLEQGQNKRNSKKIETPWGVLSQSAAARKAGISLGSLIHRMKSDWPSERWFEPARRAS